MSAAPAFLRDVDAISLDCGGVLTTPDHGMIAYALTRHGIPHDRTRFTEGHYRAMEAIDRNGVEPEKFGHYITAFLRTIAVPDEQAELAVEALEQVLVPPAWIQRLPGALDAASRLKAAGFRLAVTSNADGTIEDSLRRHEILQVGPGPGLDVEYVGDSGVVGHHKPHPAMFLATVEALDLPPERICHVGDSANFDAVGAANVGMVPVHVDPHGWCNADHHHVTSLAALANCVSAEGGPSGGVT